MRLNESIIVSAPPKLLWEYITDPGNALHYMSGVTRWEVVGEQRSGLGARYRMLIQVGSAEVGGLIEVVEFSDAARHGLVVGDRRRPARPLAPARDRRRSHPGRASLRLRGRGRPGSSATSPSTSPRPRCARHLRRSLQQLKRQVEHERLRRDAAERRADARRETARPRPADSVASRPRVRAAAAVTAGPLATAPTGLEARPVAGAVPGALGGVPAHDAAEVRAARRDRVQPALLVAVDRLLARPSPITRPSPGASSATRPPRLARSAKKWRPDSALCLSSCGAEPSGGRRRGSKVAPTRSRARAPRRRASGRGRRAHRQAPLAHPGRGQDAIGERPQRGRRRAGRPRACSRAPTSGARIRRRRSARARSARAPRSARPDRRGPSRATRRRRSAAPRPRHGRRAQRSGRALGLQVHALRQRLAATRTLSRVRAHRVRRGRRTGRGRETASGWRRSPARPSTCARRSVRTPPPPTPDRPGALVDAGPVVVERRGEPEQVLDRMELGLVVEADRRRDLERQLGLLGVGGRQARGGGGLDLGLDLAPLGGVLGVGEVRLAPQIAIDLELGGDALDPVDPPLVDLAVDPRRLLAVGRGERRRRRGRAARSASRSCCR